MAADMKTVGRWTALTALTPMPRYWSLWLKVYWALAGAAGNLSPPVRSLGKLAIIGYARWSRLHRKALPHPFQPFESNFNGAMNEYLEAFSLVVPGGMRLNWWRACGVPDVGRVGEFLRYVNRAALPVPYYHCAYPQHSTRMIRSALELSRRRRDFKAPDDPAEFRRAYEVFLSEAQRIRGFTPPRKRDRRKVTPLSVLTAVEPGHLPALEAELKRLRAEPPTLPDGTHFARWVVVPRLEGCGCKSAGGTSYLVFAAWFDGELDDYLPELGGKLGDWAGAIWGHCGLQPGRDLSRYLKEYEVPVGASFPGYAGVSVAQIKAALERWQAFRALAVRSHELSDTELQSEWAKLP
jgi:hypothetical protein